MVSLILLHTKCTISDPGTSGTYFYHISGNNNDNNTAIILPVAVNEEIIVLVLDFQFSADSNNYHFTVYANGQADLDDNSIAITKPSAKVKVKDVATKYYYRITLVRFGQKLLADMFIRPN